MPPHTRRPSWPKTLAIACLAGLAFGPLALAAIDTPGPDEAGPWRQSAERMPLATDPKGGATAAPKPELAPWIWGPDEKREYRLTKAFQGGAKTAVLVATCDNAMKLFVNGTQVAASDTWEAPIAIDVTKHLRDLRASR